MYSTPHSITVSRRPVTATGEWSVRDREREAHGVGEVDIAWDIILISFDWIRRDTPSAEVSPSESKSSVDHSFGAMTRPQASVITTDKNFFDALTKPTFSVIITQSFFIFWSILAVVIDFILKGKERNMGLLNTTHAIAAVHGSLPQGLLFTRLTQHNSLRTSQCNCT